MELFLNFVLLMLAAVGLSHIVADGSIFASVKVWLSGKGVVGQKLLEMLNCYQCNGFWSGILTSTAFWFAGYTPWFYIIFWGFTISIVSPLFGYLKLYAAILTSGDADGGEENLLNE